MCWHCFQSQCHIGTMWGVLSSLLDKKLSKSKDQDFKSEIPSLLAVNSCNLSPPRDDTGDLWDSPDGEGNTPTGSVDKGWNQAVFYPVTSQCKGGRAQGGAYNSKPLKAVFNIHRRTDGSILLPTPGRTATKSDGVVQISQEIRAVSNWSLVDCEQKVRLFLLLCKTVPPILLKLPVCNWVLARAASSRHVDWVLKAHEDLPGAWSLAGSAEIFNIKEGKKDMLNAHICVPANGLPTWPFFSGQVVIMGLMGPWQRASQTLLEARHYL